MINKNLDTQKLSEGFSLDARVRIANFLEPTYAERLQAICQNEINFDTHFVLNGQYQTKSARELSTLTREQGAQLSNQINTAAAKGVGFLYGGYVKSLKEREDSSLREDESKVFVHQCLNYFGDHEVLEFIKKVTGKININNAEPQLTRYLPGNFLTRHKDVVPGRGRRLAFVLSLSKGWHPDWGGLLQFFQDDGTPRESWCPEFNTLSIFDVRHIHSVTYVTPFAPIPRYSLTGWFVQK